MDSNIFDFLPSILPSGRINTTETFTYKTFPDGEGGSVDKKEYQLSKAPVNSVKDVSVIVNEKEISLEKNDDWIIEDNERIIFTDGKHPDPDTDFTVTYSAQSVLSRYLESVEEETESVDDEIGVNSTFSTDNNTVVSSKYISTARDEELDEIGKLFGPLGRRAGRDTERYRQYLKGISNVYNGRGTKDSVANVVSTVVSSEDVKVERDEIGFKEYFNDNEYSITFDRFENHRISLLYDIAEIADPSGVKFVGPTYNLNSDGPTFTEGPQVSVNEYEQFDTLSDVPSDFIDPLAPQENIRRELNIFEDNVTSEKRPPRDFEWAHQKISTAKGADGGNWNEFQWGENDWDSFDEIDIEITGDYWEFADWNRITSQGTFGPGNDPALVTDSTSTTVSDRLTDSTVGTTDDVIVRFLVGTEDVVSSSSIFSDVTTTTSDNTNFKESVSLDITDEIWNRGTWGEGLAWV
jgi:hypothetical protein